MNEKSSSEKMSFDNVDTRKPSNGRRNGAESLKIPPKLNLLPTVRSVIHIGNLQIYNNKRWGWFHRKMMTLAFGWQVENTDGD